MCAHRNTDEERLAERISKQFGPERVAVLEMLQAGVRVDCFEFDLCSFDCQRDRPQPVIRVAVKLGVVLLA